MYPADRAYWPEDADVELYEFDDIPGRRDLVLIGSDEIELLRQHGCDTSLSRTGQRLPTRTSS